MSQHSFTTTLQGRPVVVVVGYDRPLRGFFCFVEKCDAVDDGAGAKVHRQAVACFFDEASVSVAIPRATNLADGDHAPGGL